jgi:hypothetical protein
MRSSNPLVPEGRKIQIAKTRDEVEHVDAREEGVASEREAIRDGARADASFHLTEGRGKVVKIRSASLWTDVHIEGDLR